MKSLYIVIGMTLFLTIANSAPSNEIDIVLNMLADLQGNSSSELELLNSQWESTKEKKNIVINSLSNSVQQQRGECNLRDQDVSNKERDISITLNFIGWLEKRTLENNKRIELLDSVRCQSNSNFINDVKNTKKTLNLITYLRKAIQTEKECDLPALLQKTEFKNHFTQFMKAQEKISVLLQMSQTVDREGFESSENDLSPQLDVFDATKLQTLQVPQFVQAAVEVEANPNQELENEAQALAETVSHEGSRTTDSYTTYQQELLDILNEIETEIKGNISHAQDNQVSSAMGYNDFKGLLRRENDAFAQHLVQENENLHRLENQLITVLQACAQCKSRLQQINQALVFANQDLSSSEENYNAVLERLQSEVGLFGDIYRVYVTQVGSQADDYKAGVQSKIRA